MVSREKNSNEFTTIDITFDQLVTISKTFYPRLSFTKLFTDLGGSLGLWLGVGLKQMCLFGLNLFYNSKQLCF